MYKFKTHAHEKKKIKFIQQKDCCFLFLEYIIFIKTKHLKDILKHGNMIYEVISLFTDQHSKIMSNDS
jgi:hypothetical protein